MIAIGIVAVLSVAGCAGASQTANSPANSAAASSSPTSPAETPSAGTSSAAGGTAPRPTPTLVPFFEKLNANGSSTHFDLSRVLPGATCTVAVTVFPDASKPGKTVTYTQRDFAQDLRPKVADRAGTVNWDVQNPPDQLLSAPGGRWSGDCKLYDRNQPDFVVYHQSSSLSFGSVPSTSSSAPPGSTHTPPPASAPTSRSTPSP